MLIRISIVHTFPLSEIETLASESHSCAELLGLEEFRSERTVPQVAAELRKRNMPLRPDAIARIARTFGLDGPYVQIEQIKDFVASLVRMPMYGLRMRHTLTLYLNITGGRLDFTVRSDRGCSHYEYLFPLIRDLVEIAISRSQSARDRGRILRRLSSRKRDYRFLRSP
jgi:hypothetical protein